jgi:hypothetical protein
LHLSLSAAGIGPATSDYDAHDLCGRHDHWPGPLRSWQTGPQTMNISQRDREEGDAQDESDSARALCRPMLRHGCDQRHRANLRSDGHRRLRPRD